MVCRLFFSDCHISAGMGLDSDGTSAHPWEWLTRTDQARLLGFLKWVATRAARGSASPPQPLDEVVLLGDIFDNWIFPHDVKPPTLIEILRSPNATPLVRALGDLSEAINTIYIPGNHDLTMTEDVLHAFLPKVTFAGRSQDHPFIGWGRLRAEHGHSYGLFNAPDPLRPDHLPLGYFVGRMVATADRQTGSHTPSISAEITELAQVVTSKEELPQGVFDGICRKAGVSATTEIQMPDDLWGGTKTTVGYVRDLYKNLFHEWVDRNGTVSAALAIPAELNDLSLIADSIFLHGGVLGVIMGHTHLAVSQQHSIPIVANRIYVNTGSWCNKTTAASWAEAEKSPQGSVTITVHGCTGIGADGRPIEPTKPLLPPVGT